MVRWKEGFVVGFLAGLLEKDGKFASARVGY